MYLSLLSGSKGATLIETIVAIGLTGVILTAITTLVLNSVSSSTLSKSKTGATRLAEEGIEQVRAVRDSQDWSSFFGSYVKAAPSCISTPLHAGNNNTLVAGSEKLPGSNNTPNIYTRSTIVCDASTSGCSQNRALIDTKVTWTDRGSTQTVDLTTYVTDWTKKC